MLSFRRYASKSLTYYQILDIPPGALIKEIKHQFKKLSKKFHPDLNNHLEGEEREVNSEKYLQMVNAYDTLKDKRKKREYDGLIAGRTGASASSGPRQWNNTYYGEAKYYSKSGQTSQSYSYMNSKKHRTYDPAGHTGNSHFHGRHKNYGDRFDVPHFDYQSHLEKLLHHERRMINKSLTPEQQARILANLTKSGIKLNQETITKHLLRHVHSVNPQGGQKQHTANQHVYREEEAGGLGKVVLGLGGVIGGFLLWKWI